MRALPNIIVDFFSTSDSTIIFVFVPTDSGGGCCSPEEGVSKCVTGSCRDSAYEGSVKLDPIVPVVLPYVRLCTNLVFKVMSVDFGQSTVASGLHACRCLDMFYPLSHSLYASRDILDVGLRFGK